MYRRINLQPGHARTPRQRGGYAVSPGRSAAQSWVSCVIGSEPASAGGTYFNRTGNNWMYRRINLQPGLARTPRQRGGYAVSPGRSAAQSWVSCVIGSEPASAGGTYFNRAGNNRMYRRIILQPGHARTPRLRGGYAVSPGRSAAQSWVSCVIGSEPASAGGRRYLLSGSRPRYFSIGPMVGCAPRQSTYSVSRSSVLPFDKIILRKRSPFARVRPP